MQKRSLLSVKQAAELLQLDERSVRERLSNGQLKGEKRSKGLREIWFVHANSVDAALGKEGTFLGGEIDATEEQAIDAEFSDFDDNPSLAAESKPDWIELNRDKVKLLAEEIVRPLMVKLDTQAETIFEQRRQIADQQRQLRLLPDLQKQAEEERMAAELRALEVEALNKQIAAMEVERNAAEQVKQKVLKLEQALTASQQQAQKEIERSKEAHAQAIEQLKAADDAKIAEKEAEAATFKEQLAALSATVEELKKPKPSWWQKWFTAPSDQS